MTERKRIKTFALITKIVNMKTTIKAVRIKSYRNSRDG